MRTLNLAGQPFRNERLGETAFALGAALLLGVTVWHALEIRDLLPARTSVLHREVAALDAEIESLRKEAASKRTEAPPKPVLEQWNLVKDLVDQRAFSWAALFATLEEVIPDDVRLTSITPAVLKGAVEVDISATVRAPAAGWEFVRALEERAEFYDVYPTSEDDRAFRYKMRYRPRAMPPLGAAPAASASAAPGDGNAATAETADATVASPGPTSPETEAGPPAPHPSASAPTSPAPSAPSNPRAAGPGLRARGSRFGRPAAGSRE